MSMTMQEKKHQMEEDHQSLILLVPQLVSGMNQQRDILAALQASQEKTNTIQEHMLAELKVLKDDRITGDRRIEERLSGLELQYHASRQAPWSLLLSATGIAVSIAGIVGGLVYFAISSETNDLRQIVDRNYEVMQEHNRLAGHPHSVIEKIEALDKRLQSQIQATNDRFDRREERWNHMVDSINSKLDELTKRVHPLYKEGKPY